MNNKPSWLAGGRRDELLGEVLLFSESTQGNYSRNLVPLCDVVRNASRRSSIFFSSSLQRPLRRTGRDRSGSQSKGGVNILLFNQSVQDPLILQWMVSKDAICRNRFRFLFLLPADNKSLWRARDTNGDTSVALLRTVTAGKSLEKLDGVIGNAPAHVPHLFSCRYVFLLLILSAVPDVTKR